MFEGVIPALVTPFKENFEVDYEGISKNLDYLEKYVDAVVPAGTTGEAATLSYEEHIDVVRYVCDVSKKPVIAGAGSNSTREALYLAIYVTKDIALDGIGGIEYIAKIYNFEKVRAGELIKIFKRYNKDTTWYEENLSLIHI